MNNLTDRYVAAVARGLPQSQRRDVELELLTGIADAVEDRTANGEPFAAAERAVLTDLGDPARLAATYVDRPSFLVGPVLFPDYRRLLGVLLAIVLPIVVLIDVIAGLSAGDGIGPLIGSAVVTLITVGAQVAFWTTLAFAILEWTGANSTRPLVPWSLDALPELDSTRTTPGQVIPALVMLALFAVAIVWQQITPFFPGAGDDRVPGLNPDLWSFWLPVLLVILLAESVFEVVRYRVGHWTPGLAIVNTALNLVFAIPFATLALRGELINPEVFAGFDWPEGAEAGSPVAIVISCGIVAVAVWDIGDAWLQVWRADRRVSLHGMMPVR